MGRLEHSPARNRQESFLSRFRRPHIEKLLTKEDVTSLLAAVDHPNDSIRSAALSALGKLEEMRAPKLAKAALIDPALTVRVAALDILKTTPPDSTLIPALRESVLGTSDIKQRQIWTDDFIEDEHPKAFKYKNEQRMRHPRVWDFSRYKDQVPPHSSGGDLIRGMREEEKLAKELWEKAHPKLVAAEMAAQQKVKELSHHLQNYTIEMAEKIGGYEAVNLILEIHGIPYFLSYGSKEQSLPAVLSAIEKAKKDGSNDAVTFLTKAYLQHSSGLPDEVENPALEALITLKASAPQKLVTDATVAIDWPTFYGRGGHFGQKGGYSDMEREKFTNRAAAMTKLAKFIHDEQVFNLLTQGLSPSST